MYHSSNDIVRAAVNMKTREPESQGAKAPVN